MADERQRDPAPAAGRAPAPALDALRNRRVPRPGEEPCAGDPPGARGRLIFALDATMSRQPTWDTACRLQADMFREAAAIGGLDVQLVYYRGLGECRASRWVSQAERLGDADGADRLPRRPHPDRQGARARAARDREQQGAGAGLRRRRDGGEARRPLPGGRRARPARRAGLHVPGRRRPDRRAGVSRDRAADPRRLLPLRSRARRTSWPSCCARWRPMRPAACARSPISPRGAMPARIKLLEQMRYADGHDPASASSCLRWCCGRCNALHQGQSANGSRRCSKPAAGSARSPVPAFLARAGGSTIGDAARLRRPGPARLAALEHAGLRRAHAQEHRPGLARALGLRGNGARSRHRRDARAHPCRAARGRRRSTRSTSRR